MKNGPQDELQEIRRWLADAWSMHLREVLEAMTFEPVRVAVVDPRQARGGEDEAILWWKQSLSYPEQGAVWVGASSAARGLLAKKVLAAAGVEEEDSDLLLRTYQEVVQQTTPALARVIGAKLNREITCSEGDVDPDGPPDAPFSIQARYSEEQAPLLLLGFDPALAAGIRASQQSGENPAARSPRVAGDSPLAALPPPADDSGPPKTIDLLLDVELPVSVSFGRAYLPLKDVLRLTSGSIVELNRPVADPVEVIVNNCVIARGEVVVIDGNYGVRISRIISRQDRLRTLS
ncbi:MAG: flagellar motor switch protein FliN [Bryobacteraceae bacterium]|nr:flagellar motor switch protein FliN [Bryobacteraceae bacterium]